MMFLIILMLAVGAKGELRECNGISIRSDDSTIEGVIFSAVSEACCIDAQNMLLGAGKILKYKCSIVIPEPENYCVMIRHTTACHGDCLTAVLECTADKNDYSIEFSDTRENRSITRNRRQENDEIDEIAMPSDVKKLTKNDYCDKSDKHYIPMNSTLVESGYKTSESCEKMQIKMGPWTVKTIHDEVCIALTYCPVKRCYRLLTLHRISVQSRNGKGANQEMMDLCGWDFEHIPENTNFPKCSCSEDEVTGSFIEVMSDVEMDGCPDSHLISRLMIDREEMIVFTKVSHARKCVSKICTFDVVGKPNRITVTLKSLNGMYSLQSGDEKKEGEFKVETKVEFDVLSPGLHSVRGYCNFKPIIREFVSTTEEYCDNKHSDWTGALSRIYCKHYKGLHVVMFTIVTCLALYFLDFFIAVLLGSIFGLFFYAISYMCMRSFYCDRCLKICLRKGHKCMITQCPYCFESIGGTFQSEASQKNAFNSHISDCRYKNKQSKWFACLRLSYYVMFSIFYEIFRRIPKIVCGIALIFLLAYMIPLAEGKNHQFEERIANMIMKEYGKNLSEAIASSIKELKASPKYEVLQRDFNKKCIFITLSIEIPLLMVLFLLISIILFSRKASSIIYRLARRYYGGWILCDKCYTFSPTPHGIEGLDCGTLWCPVCHISLGIQGLQYTRHNIRDFFAYHVANHRGLTKKEVWIIKNSCVIKSNAFNFSRFVLVLLITCAMMQVSLCSTSHAAEMAKVEKDMSEYIQALEKSGFHPYHARFTGGARMKISNVEEKKTCGRGKCMLSMEIESDMTVVSGKEFGYEVTSKELGKSVTVNIKIVNPISQCSYKHIYSTGSVIHRGVTDDTCTSNCDSCLEGARALNPNIPKNTNKHQQIHPDSSSWACDGPGCASMGSGCTCLECWCELHDSSDAGLSIGTIGLSAGMGVMPVYKMVQEEHQFDICISVGQTGYCKTIKKDTRNDILTVMEFSQGKMNCPPMITCMKEICYSGSINDINEDLDIFGSVKLIGDFLKTTKEISAHEICHFARSRYYTMEKCCKDTFFKLADLEHTKLKKANGTNIWTQTTDNLGSWKIRIRVPHLIFDEKIDTIKITDMKIVDCKGCYKCNEGGSCRMTLTSTHTAPMDFGCQNCRFDSNIMQVKKGFNNIPFNIFCNKKSDTIKCDVGNFTAEGHYDLKEIPKVPHGDGVINVDVSKNLQEKCDGFFCSFSMPFLDIWKRFKYAVILIITGLVILITIWLFSKLFKSS